MPEHLRAATTADIPALNAIYNAYVLKSECTMQTEPTTDAERVRWLEARAWEGFPVLVLEREGTVLGWGALLRYSEREGYRLTAEDSVYLREDAVSAGRGGVILAALLERARELGLHRVVARVVPSQLASMALHRRCGFVEQGRLLGVGQKFGRWWDVAFLVWNGP